MNSPELYTHFRTQACSRQWCGFLRALAQEFAEVLAADDLALLMARIGCRFAGTHPIGTCATLDEVQAGVNRVWERMEWGYARFEEQADRVDKNLSGHTYGQGGYFSPQDYVDLGFPVHWSGRSAGRKVNWSVDASVGVQHFRSDDSTYFPTSAQLQQDAYAAASLAALLGLVDSYTAPVYAGQSKTGVSYNLAGAAGWQLAPAAVPGWAAYLQQQQRPRLQPVQHQPLRALRARPARRRPRPPTAGAGLAVRGRVGQGASRVATDLAAAGTCGQRPQALQQRLRPRRQHQCQAAALFRRPEARPHAARRDIRRLQAQRRYHAALHHPV
ncbi:hypothetical protein NZ30_16520 [Xanthomonas translucens pv. undulosa]|nr:hypothetical protein NZ30_16520 [Xanthomonas translucens pv. undulosa]